MSSSTKVLPFVAVNNREHLYSYWLKKFYNAGVFYFVSPGLYKWDKKEYVYKRNLKILQLFLVILQFWALVAPFVAQYSFAQTGVCPDRGGPKGFTKVIIGCSILIWALIIVITFTSFRNRTQAFLDVLATVNRVQEFLASAGIHPTSTKSIRCVFFGIIVFPPIAAFTLRFIFIGKIYEKSIALFLHEEMCGIRIPQNSTDVDTLIRAEDPSLSPAFNVLAVFIILGKLGGGTAGWFLKCTALIHAFTFYFLAKDFVCFLKQKQTQDENPGSFVKKADLVLKIFKQLCGLSYAMEDSFGLVTAFVCFRTPFFFSVVSNYISAQNWGILVEVIMYSLITGSFYFFSAEANSQLGAVSYWLQNAIEEFSKDDMDFKSNLNFLGLRVQLALNQLQTNQLGIRCRAFTITYGFVGGMAVLMLNYTILYYQLTT